MARVQVPDWSWRQWRCWELTAGQQQRLSRCIDRDLHGCRPVAELEFLAAQYPLRFGVDMKSGQSPRISGRTTSSTTRTA